MQRGIFTSTFYIPEGPTISAQPLDLNLTPDERRIVRTVLATETMERVKLEMAAAGQGLIWHKDHFEVIPNVASPQNQNLMTHRM